MRKDFSNIGQGPSRYEPVYRPIFSLPKKTTRRHIGDLAIARLLLLSGLLGLLLCLSATLSAQEQRKADPRNVEAAFLRNFAHYITWPDGVFADSQTPWRICIVGSDPFGEVLEKTFEGRIEQGRPFTILRTQKPAELKNCQIAYLAYITSANRRAALSSLQGLPVLTVSNAPDFLQEGGIIRFDVTDYVELNVNLDQARAASLTIQTKVLEVSRAVIENGTVRRIR
jgi:hypothetical protein